MELVLGLVEVHPIPGVVDLAWHDGEGEDEQCRHRSNSEHLRRLMSERQKAVGHHSGRSGHLFEGWWPMGFPTLASPRGSASIGHRQGRAIVESTEPRMNLDVDVPRHVE
jgi:hypothetical protein